MRAARGLAGLVAFVSLAGASPPAGAADIYRCVGEGEVLHFSNAPTSDCFRRFIRVEEERPPSPLGPARAAGPAGAARAVAPARYEGPITEAAARHGVEPALIKAVIRAESNFNAKAVSRRGAQGLMQLMPATAALYDVRDPFEARASIDAGTRHLRTLLDLYQGNLVLALAAYNAGAQALARHGGRVPPYLETYDYIEAVLRHLDAYRGAAPRQAGRQPRAAERARRAGELTAPVPGG